MKSAKCGYDKVQLVCPDTGPNWKAFPGDRLLSAVLLCVPSASVFQRISSEQEGYAKAVETQRHREHRESWEMLTR